ncbi:MAG: hypothetical protein IJT79_03665 [Ruminococcus sp.]|nr:hypothetical protein [Ruminococcus sp.]
MKTSKKIISSVLAVIIVVSAMAISGFSASAATLKKPSGFKVTNANHSIYLQWNKVSGAKKYQIYKNSKLYKTVSSVGYKDYTVTGGQTYSYKVRGINGSKKGTFTSTIKSTRLNFTVITSLENAKSGIEVKWVARTSVTKYIVERTVYGINSYVKVGETTGLSLIDNTAVPGTTYTYRVTCYNSTTKSSSTVSVGVKVTRVLPVTGFSANAAVDRKTRQVTLKWTGSTGAESYNIYRQKITDEDFSKIATVASTHTAFIDTDIIKNPSAYRYIVTAVAGDSESVNSVERFVQTYSYEASYFDVPNEGVRNYHVPLFFNVGDEYAEGQYLADYFSYNGFFEVDTSEANGVVSVENNVIKALQPGTCKVVLTVPETVRSLITDEETFGDDLVALLTSRKVILEITVL